MTRTELQDTYDSICETVCDAHIKNGLDELQELIAHAKLAEFKEQHTQLSTTYKYLLKYSVDGVKDPKRPEVLRHLQNDILDLTDSVATNVFFNTVDDIPGYSLKEAYRVGQMVQQPQIDQFAEGTLEKAGDFVSQLFRRIWLSSKLKDFEADALRDINLSAAVPATYKAVLVSALSLSSIFRFQNTKFSLLTEFVRQREDQVWQRALVGLVIAAYLHNNRMGLHPELLSDLEALSKIPEIGDELERIIIQLIRSQDTERLSQHIKEEIVDEVIKISPKLTRKFKDLDNLMQDSMDEDKNPDWEAFFEDSPDLFEKMSQLSNLQMEGADILMSSFGMLKNFDFFNDIKNWFMPFDHRHKQVKKSTETLGAQGETFAKRLQDIPFICNSDKYSFCMNIAQLPDQQRQMVLNLFMNDLEGMEELAKEDEELNKPSTKRFIYTQYVQDLYRFFKLYPNKALFTDVFDLDLDIYNTNLFNIVAGNNENTLRNIGEFYLKQNYFVEALEVFEKLLNSGATDYELYQKTAFCHQKLDDWQLALEFYLKAEFFDKNKLWNMKKIGLCYLQLEQPNKALEYYKQIEKLEPENLNVQVNIGKCLLELGDYEAAHKIFFKVEYLSPNNIKAMRPIVWCSLVLGKFDTAEKYLERILTQSPDADDYLNLGHVKFCQGNINNAVANYLKCIRENDNDIEWFMEEFEEDVEYLLKQGVDEADIPLLLDHIRYQTEA